MLPRHELEVRLATTEFLRFPYARTDFLQVDCIAGSPSSGTPMSFHFRVFEVLMGGEACSALDGYIVAEGF